MKHILNQFFDRIYCITVHTFTDRHKLVKEQLAGVEFEWILSPPSQSLAPRSDITLSETSITLGQASLLQNAKLHGYKRIAMWEDDGIMSATPMEMEAFFNEVPSKWDCLHMGDPTWANSIWPIDVEHYSENVNRVRRGNGCTFMGINSHLFDELSMKFLQFGKATDLKFQDISYRGRTYGPKKYFSLPVSMPHERTLHHFTPEQLSTFIPSYVAHSL